MGQVAVVTDSGACLPPEVVAALGIEVVPLRFYIGDRSFLDGVDITANDIYRMLPKARTVPTTSAPTPLDYYAAIERASRSHDAVLIITITRRFSGMYQSATLAATTARDTLPDTAVLVMDSGTAAGAEGLVVLNAARAAFAGANVDEVCEVARRTMEQVDLIATLETLYYLARSGRVPMAVHWANAVVRVNPLFRILPLSGEAKTVRVARGRESAVRQMLELVQQRLAGRDMHGVVFHSYRFEEAMRLRERVTSMFTCREMYVSDFTPAMGIHTGPGVLGLAYYAAE
jgi:DegV family protein with EDD domain